MKTWERGIKKIEQGEETYRKGSKVTETELRWALLGVIDTLYECERASSREATRFYIRAATEKLLQAQIYLRGIHG